MAYFCAFWRFVISYKLKPGIHWRQSWIQHGRLRWKSTIAEIGNKSATKSTVAVYVQLCCRFWQQIDNNVNLTSCRGRPCCRYVQFDLLPIRSTLLPVCVRGQSDTKSTLSTFNKVDRVEFNFVASVKACNSNAPEGTIFKNFLGRQHSPHPRPFPRRRNKSSLPRL